MLQSGSRSRPSTTPPGDDPSHGPTEPVSPPLDFGAALWRSLPGRLVLISSGLLLLLLAAGRLVDLPFAFDLLRRITWISWLVGSAWFVALAVLRNRKAFLWRVRRKLLLSYVFFGVVPVGLIMAFVLAAAVLLYVTVAAYVFRENYAESVRFIRDVAATSAVEIGRTPTLAASGLERRYDNLSARFPGLSLALVPLPESPGQAPREVLSAGAWTHMSPPSSVPAWVVGRGGFAGTLLIERPAAEPLLFIRAAVPTADGSRMAIADLPIDPRFAAAIREATGVEMGQVGATTCGPPEPTLRQSTTAGWSTFRETVAFLNCTDWASGAEGRLSVALVAPVGEIYAHLAELQAPGAGSPLTDWASVLLQLLWLLGFLFLIIQGSAVVMGALLAKSITSAIHELFEGTERVRTGDFAHRIRIDSKDQLGELAGSFNRMSESIERLLHVEREKQRLDDELRIAREIQKSLLPVHPPVLAGLDIADLCEPAREVGGDYYDFFELAPNILGVLIADVSGKGTSAALYMAELKGIMLALSRSDRSPRNILKHVNGLLAGHLDNRSFITMTYAIIDLDRRVIRLARAGHTPMIIVSSGQAAIVAPDGMVLGLRLPDADRLFDQVLDECELPIATGDVIVLYTDGVTEAMDAAGEMFGDSGLARVVTSQRELSAAGIRERVVREVRAFTGAAEAHDDDMTMVVIKIGDPTVAVS